MSLPHCKHRATSAAFATQVNITHFSGAAEPESVPAAGPLGAKHEERYQRPQRLDEAVDNAPWQDQGRRRSSRDRVPSSRVEDLGTSVFERLSYPLAIARPALDAACKSLRVKH